MGNESSVVGRLEYLKESSVPVSQTCQMLQAVSDNDENYSVFHYKLESDNAVRCIDRSIKALKSLRHPNILKFIEHVKTSEFEGVVTDCVKSLNDVIEHLSAYEICQGLFSVLEAINFLHTQAGIVHNSITTSSIFVTNDGIWKLGYFDLSCKAIDCTNEYLQKIRPLQNVEYLAPEDKERSVAQDPDAVFAQDCYAVGVLCRSLLEHLTELGDLTKTFEYIVRDEFLSTSARKRPPVSCLLTNKLFKNAYVDIVQFLKRLPLKTEKEKDVFYRSLVSQLFLLPVALVAQRLVKPLLSRFVLLDPLAQTYVVPHLLTPCTTPDRPTYLDNEMNPLFPRFHYQKHVVPELIRIFFVHDLTVRCVLLSHFSAYAREIDHDTLRTHVLPEVLLGLRDRDDRLVALSLHAVADLVEVLKGDVVMGRRTTIFRRGHPKTHSVSNDPTPSPKYKEDGVAKSAVFSKQKQSRAEERERKREEFRRRQQERRAAARKITDDSLSESMHQSRSPEILEQSSEITEDTISSEDDAPEHNSEPVRSPVYDAPKVDWGDVTPPAHDAPARSPSGISKHGALQLKVTKENAKVTKQKTSPPPSRRPDSDDLHEPLDLHGDLQDDGGWGNSWDVEDAPAQRQVSSPESSPRPAPPRSRSGGKESLGAEFDVMSIKVKATQRAADPLADLFADLEPVIKVDKKTEAHAPRSDLFKVTAGGQEGSGWADEGWGDDW